jgi:hypothetical protein
LGSIAVALLLIFVLGERFSPARLQRTASEARLFPGFTVDKAVKIDVFGKQTQVSLNKSGAWTIAVGGAQYPAAESKITFLLQEIVSLRVGTLVTRNAASSSALGLDSAEAVRLVVYGAKGEALCELSAGKAGPAGKGKYIRVGKGPEVYETGDALSPYLTAETRFWENLKVFPQDLKSSDIVGLKISGRVSLTGGKDTGPLSYELARTKDRLGAETWSLVGQAGTGVDAQRVRSVLDALIGFEGNDIDASPQVFQGIRTAPKVTITLLTGSTGGFVLFIGDRVEGDQYPCALQNGSYSYRIPEWRISQALVTKESLAPQPR